MSLQHRRHWHPTTLLTTLIAASTTVTDPSATGQPSAENNTELSSGGGGGSGGYTLHKTYDSSNFFDEFTFQTGPDKWTNGFAMYQSETDAKSAGLATTSNNVIHLGADSTNTVSNDDSSSSGRNSFRVQSNDVFSTGLLVADFKHVPGNACGIWPAFWLLNDSDNYAEIDLLEAVSMDKSSTISIYTTTSPCDLEKGDASSSSIRTNCVTSQQQITNVGGGGVGCGASTADDTFGDGFNTAGGGVWAFQLESDVMKAWVWQRDDVPSDLASGSPNPSSWPKPTMNFSPGTCSLEKAFNNLKIVINLTFCGDDAGNAGGWNGYGGGAGCSTTTKVAQCNQYVGQTPSAFKEAYFDINYIKLFSQS